MDNDNKKDYNDDLSKINIEGYSKAFDEITDGFYDLSQLYSADPKKKPVQKSTVDNMSREQKLRLKDEERREQEMKAIKEDIERRYSLQLESARNKADAASNPKDGSVSTQRKNYITIDEKAVDVKDELNKIDEIIGKKNIVEPFYDNDTENDASSNSVVAEKNKSKKRSKEEKFIPFDPKEKNAVYAWIYIFGDIIYRFITRTLKIIFSLISYPFISAYKYINRVTEKSKYNAKKRLRSSVYEIKNFRKEIRRAKRTILIAMKSPKSLPSVISHYIKKALFGHKSLLESFINIAAPVAALIIFFITIAHWNGVTFALEVIYNDQPIGYINSESVFIEARDMVKDRLSTNALGAENTEATTAAASANLNASYELCLVSLEQLNDVQTISDKMIENSVDNLTNACGIYINNRFICAVKNESDAKTIFNNILAPYEDDAKKNGYVVSFNETINYVQGLYRDDNQVMWDASQLENVLKSSDTSNVYHTVAQNDSIESISAQYGVSAGTLRILNPDYDWNNINEGDTIIIQQSTKLISIKKVITSTYLRDIKYDTVTRRDATKYSGYKDVTQVGVNGSERVTKTTVYIDDELYDTQFEYLTIEEPIDEIVTIGTRTTYGGVYVGTPSTAGFLWPAPSCHTVSSPYGWRSRGWHTGIDLIKGGGGAYGTPVIASRSGVVEKVQVSNSGYGNMVLINHGDGYKTRYAHMITGSITVSVGEYVEAGKTLGKVGSTGNSTGPHLHFEVIYKGETQNPAYYIYN